MPKLLRNALIAAAALGLVVAFAVLQSDKLPDGATTAEKPVSEAAGSGNTNGLSVNEANPVEASQAKGWLEVANPFSSSATQAIDPCPSKDEEQRAMCLKGREIDERAKIACPQTDEAVRKKCMVKFIFG